MNQMTPRLIAMFVFAIPAFAQERPSQTQEATKAKPRNPSLATIEDVAGLPRVLLIGDSISIGYTIPTRELLEGKANVHRIGANGGPTTRGLASIDKWLGDGPWDVIHFNWGIHDLRHMPDGKRQVEPDDYEANLEKLVARLKQTGATLVFATTTPIPKGKLNPDRTFGSETQYNQIAHRVMERHGVIVNDLHGYVMPKFDRYHKPRDLHYTEEGSQFLAEKVAKVIAETIAEQN